MSVLLTQTGLNFNHNMPTNLHFGYGSVSKLPSLVKQLNVKKPLIITGRNVSKLDAYKKSITLLRENKIEAIEWNGVVEDPTDKSITEGVVHYREGNCDGLIAYGGGSSIDSAKAIGVLAHHGGDDIIPYTGWVPSLQVTSIPPFICVPTTSGTGSEVTNASVITDTKNKVKTAILSSKLFPGFSIVDPELTVSMPPKVTAATGMDALAHSIGTYTHGSSANPISDALALYAMELISTNLRKAVYDGGNVSARTNMSLASSLAGMAFNTGGLHLEHAVAHMLGAKYHVPHGVACVLLMPEILEFILPAKVDRLKKMADVFGFDTRGLSERAAAELGIEGVFQLMGDVGIPSMAKATGATLENVPMLADDAFGYMWSSPREISVDDFKLMFIKALSR
jgi:alcohol dehydrogenase class IV